MSSTLTAKEFSSLGFNIPLESILFMNFSMSKDTLQNMLPEVAMASPIGR